jgi:hypothetical protein
VRERYVWQVLLVTLGFGVLLAVFAVVDTPRDAFQSLAAHPYVAPTSDSIRGRPEGTLGRTTRFVDFSDECDLPSFFAPKALPSSTPECDTTVSPHHRAHQSRPHTTAGTSDDC